VELAFQKFKQAFTGPPNLQHLDPAKQIILETDASGFSIAGILKQYDSFEILWPVNFHCRKYTPAVPNYDTYVQELVAMLETISQWWHYLKGANYKIIIQCDHRNLEYFQTVIVLSRSQARWVEILSSHDLVIELLEGEKNPADWPSRRPDYKKGYERRTAWVLAPLAATTIELYIILLPAINTAQASYSLATNIKRRIVHQ